MVRVPEEELKMMVQVPEEELKMTVQVPEEELKTHKQFRKLHTDWLMTANAQFILKQICSIRNSNGMHERMLFHLLTTADN